MKVEEIPPQLLRIVVQCGDEIDMREEEEVSTEIKRLRTNLSIMMG